MNIRFWTVFGLFLMMLSACAGPQTRTQKGGVYGAAGGAAAGAIVGQAIGHDTKATLEGAAIGAAIGGLAGAGAGHYMDKQEQALRQAVAASEAAAVQRQGNILSVTLKSDFLFDVDSSVVHPGAYPEIDRLARVFTQYPDTMIRIEGHTDSTGSEEYNLHLSQRRAEAVKQLLVSKGVSSNRMTVLGYGESRPKAGNDTPYGQQLNRRVEIYIEPRR
jgi:outer membrane protein OmpA-like peptidoglycan-associated protein